MEEKLVYVKYICKNNDGSYEYNFFFSDVPDVVWGPDWDVYNPSSCIDLTPDKSTYNSVYRVVSNYPLKTLEETSCYSMEYSIYGIIALAWIDIENLEDYPENGRMVFHFGDTKENVAELLNLYDIKLEQN